MRIDLFLLFILLFSPFGWSENNQTDFEKKIEDNFPYLFQENEVQPHDNDDFQSKFFRMLFILALLIGFMIFASVVLKRMMKTRLTTINQKSEIKILESRALSPRTMLHILESGGKSLLVAETASSVTLLSTTPSVGISFAEHLNVKEQGHE